MMCDIIDLRCIFVNELAGTPIMAMLLLALIYFVTASKLKFGFDLTILYAIPFLLAFGLVVSGFSVIYAVITILVAIGAGTAFSKMMGD